MPSEKRARQRRLHDEKVAVEQQRVKRRRGIRRGIGAVIVAGVVVALVALLSNHPAPKKNAANKTTSTTAGAGATTTTKPGATTTTAASTTTTKPASTTTTKPGASTTTTKPKASTTTTVPATTTTLASETANGAPICPPAAGSAKRVITFKEPPPICISRTGVYDATITTDVGTFVMRMNAAKNLAAVNNFVFLARYRFFDGVVFHRVIPGFVVQGGDPTGTGNGGPGYSWDGPVPLKTCEASSNCYPTWTVAMANSTGPSSNGSQFFIVLPGGDAGLSALYTTVGTVTSGTNVVAKIGADGSQSGTPTHEHKMTKVTISQVSP